jgi:hypothetical protein
MTRKRKSTETLNLPPPFRLESPRGAEAFAHACEIAGPEESGTLVWEERGDAATFALVLEPEQPLRTARRVFYAGMIALGDALAALGVRDVAYEWPDAVRTGGALAGGARLAWPQGADEEALPDWLVFGATIRAEAFGPDEDAHEDDPSGAARLVDLFARRFLAALDHWHEAGFPALMEKYEKRLPPGHSGTFTEDGDLPDQTLADGLRQPSWLDAQGRVRTALRKR